MGTRRFALILGIFYTLVGLAGFIPGLLTEPVAEAPDVAVNTLYGFLLGLFPVNILHTIVHLLIGVWGIIASRSFDAARTYARVVGVLFLLLAVMGLIPGLNTTFGLIPLFSHDIWLHALTGLLGLYFGWVYRPEPAARPA
ncbi:MAG TPA: DUF4383 domain-containing protein [Anaerolineaceae bacterium]|nr:DUF4383 domain-containing protein [Anaerolineaceae bacterium]